MPDNSDCYHGFLGVSQAENRIRKSGQERGFLTRQSIKRPGFFILSFREKGKVLHHLAPNREGKYNKQTYDEAVLVLNEMILAKEECEEPLIPPSGEPGPQRRPRRGHGQDQEAGMNLHSKQNIFLY